MSLDTTVYPYRTVVRITGTFGGLGYYGSGVLISPDEVLTASHVVYLQGQGLAGNIEVSPGASVSAQTGQWISPFGTAAASAIHYFPVADRGDVLTFAESQLDYAVIHLDHRFPDLGTMGLLADFPGGAVSILGYPATSGGYLNLSSEVLKVSPTYTLLQGPTAGTGVGPGSSGGPAFVDGASGPQVVGLVSTGGGGITNFTQITRAAFNQIQDWVHVDDGVMATSPAPTPAPPMITSVTVVGAHTDYTIASADGALRIIDAVAGRNGLQTLPQVVQVQVADGVGRFDTSGHAEAVARLYQAAFDRPADLGGLENWTAQLDAQVLGIGSVAAAFITSPEFAAHYGAVSDQGFLQQLYQNVLGRSGDAGGTAYWTQALADGQARSQVLAGFSESLENRVDTRPTVGDGDLSAAYRLYQAAFNRTPDAAGLNYWTRQLDDGTALQTVARDMSNSFEYLSTYAALDPSAFVGRLYQNVLHRAGDAAGTEYWLGQLASGQTMSLVLMNFSESTENRVGTGMATHDSWVFIPN